jgi:hypothetical protein
VSDCKQSEFETCRDAGFVEDIRQVPLHGFLAD